MSPLSAQAVEHPRPEPIQPRAVAVPAAPAERKLTVLLVVPTLDSGAADYNALELAEILSKAGHRPIVVSRGGRLEPALAELGTTFVRLNVASNNPARMARNGWTIANLIGDHHCDVVHVLGRSAAWSTYPATRVKRVPFMTTWHKGFREQNAFKRLYNRVMVRGERVIASSDQIAELINERYNVPWSSIAVASTSIDPDRFDLRAVSEDRLDTVRREWGLAPERKVILAVGRLLRRKGHDLVIRAIKRLMDRGMKDFTCVFIGEDGGRSRYTGELWDLVQETGTAEYVRFVSATADVPAMYGVADVVVSAAVQPEGLQRSLLEASAMERPLVVSDLAAGPELVLSPPAVPEDRMTGLRFPAGDDSALAAAMVRALAFPEPERRAIGRRGRAWVLGNFSDADYGSQMLKIYSEVAAQRKSRST